jgi:uncharacterized membrane protein YgcG
VCARAGSVHKRASSTRALVRFLVISSLTHTSMPRFSFFSSSVHEVIEAAADAAAGSAISPEDDPYKGMTESILRQAHEQECRRARLSSLLKLAIDRDKAERARLHSLLRLCVSERARIHALARGTLSAQADVLPEVLPEDDGNWSQALQVSMDPADAPAEAAYDNHEQRALVARARAAIDEANAWFVALAESLRATAFNALALARSLSVQNRPWQDDATTGAGDEPSLSGGLQAAQALAAAHDRAAQLANLAVAHIEPHVPNAPDEALRHWITLALERLRFAAGVADLVAASCGRAPAPSAASSPNGAGAHCGSRLSLRTGVTSVPLGHTQPLPTLSTLPAQQQTPSSSPSEATPRRVTASEAGEPSALACAEHARRLDAQDWIGLVDACEQTSPSEVEDDAGAFDDDEDAGALEDDDDDAGALEGDDDGALDDDALEGDTRKRRMARGGESAGEQRKSARLAHTSSGGDQAAKGGGTAGGGSRGRRGGSSSSGAGSGGSGSGDGGGGRRGDGRDRGDGRGKRRAGDADEERDEEGEGEDGMEDEEEDEEGAAVEQTARNDKIRSWILSYLASNAPAGTSDAPAVASGSAVVPVAGSSSSAATPVADERAGLREASAKLRAALRAMAAPTPTAAAADTAAGRGGNRKGKGRAQPLPLDVLADEDQDAPADGVTNQARAGGLADVRHAASLTFIAAHKVLRPDDRPAWEPLADVARFACLRSVQSGGVPDWRAYNETMKELLPFRADGPVPPPRSAAALQARADLQDFMYAASHVEGEGGVPVPAFASDRASTQRLTESALCEALRRAEARWARTPSEEPAHEGGSGSEQPARPSAVAVATQARRAVGAPAPAPSKLSKSPANSRGAARKGAAPPAAEAAAGGRKRRAEASSEGRRDGAAERSRVLCLHGGVWVRAADSDAQDKSLLWLPADDLREEHESGRPRRVRGKAAAK